MNIRKEKLKEADTFFIPIYKAMGIKEEEIFQKIEQSSVISLYSLTDEDGERIKEEIEFAFLSRFFSLRPPVKSFLLNDQVEKFRGRYLKWWYHKDVYVAGFLTHKHWFYDMKKREVFIVYENLSLSHGWDNNFIRLNRNFYNCGLDRFCSKYDLEQDPYGKYKIQKLFTDESTFVCKKDSGNWPKKGKKLFGPLFEANASIGNVAGIEYL